MKERSIGSTATTFLGTCSCSSAAAFLWLPVSRQRAQPALIAAQATAFVGLPPVLVVLGVATLVIFATEFTSNTALAATMLPLLAAAAPVLGIPTEQVLLVTTIGASAAFMMPVATPPNAIIFGTGRIQIGEMIKAGFWLNVISIIVISGVCMVLGDVLQLPMPK